MLVNTFIRYVRYRRAANIHRFEIPTHAQGTMQWTHALLLYCSSPACYRLPAAEAAAAVTQPPKRGCIRKSWFSFGLGGESAERDLGGRLGSRWHGDDRGW